jgi:Nif-specific regulatory protein
MRRAARPGSVSELAALAELGRVLGEATSLRGALARVVEHLDEVFAATSIGVWLRDDGTELKLVAGTGQAWQARLRMRYQLGEGITGRVVQTGRPVVVPRASREPLFLNRSGALRPGGAREASFICVPVIAEGRSAGALGVLLPYRAEAPLAHLCELLVVAGTLVGHAVRVEHLVQAERKRLQQENSQLRQELKERYEFRNIIGTSRPMQALYEQMAQVAGATTTVLIRGESGTGKELIAHALHYHSPRANKPYVKVNCGALPEALVESELFGYEPGAFTDAKSTKRGRFELANGGTLFLDEVGELTPATQVKLLRVLQEREIERLGGTQPIKVNVRLIAATNRDLEAAVRDRTFREDLYYRLNVFGVYVPPLRERTSDVLLLADHFVEKYARVHGKEVRRIATTAIDLLMSYHWPGNVRELENVVERAVLVSSGGVMHAHDLPPTLQTAEVSGTLPRVSLVRAVAALERDLIQDALKSARGNLARAARLLDSTERIVAYKVRRLGLDPARFRAAPKPNMIVEPQ